MLMGVSLMRKTDKTLSKGHDNSLLLMGQGRASNKIWRTRWVLENCTVLIHIGPNNTEKQGTNG